MTRTTMKVKKTHLEASNFESKPLMPTKTELSQNSNSRIQKRQNNFEQIDRGYSKISRFNPASEKKMTCFGCRKSGHSLKNCKDTKQIQVICYHCGSDEHTTKSCPTPGKTFPFATCFICNKTGHLSSKCPQNQKGVYPNGGSCKFCGSVSHLARDCKPTSNKESFSYLGKVDLTHGGDDDDVFIALKNIQKDKNEKKLQREKSSTKKVVKF
ncbi:hypothetical protein AYI68_g8075 [Smittium mucronatum]|uniref:CCHC-type domain-containing protein n=1 Tax=Smittium mucronatum TaxID=133383 RepID=A0A1R0GLY9_9FUNG|nr:hypothetical protein AYI68_g8075 [Smittium mucronatum]